MSCVYVYKHVCRSVFLSLLFVAPCIPSDNDLVPVCVKGIGLFCVPASRFDPEYLDRVRQQEQAAIAPYIERRLDCHTNTDKNSTQNPTIYVDGDGTAHFSLE